MELSQFRRGVDVFWWAWRPAVEHVAWSVVLHHVVDFWVFVIHLAWIAAFCGQKWYALFKVSIGAIKVFLSFRQPRFVVPVSII